MAAERRGRRRNFELVDGGGGGNRLAEDGGASDSETGRTGPTLSGSSVSEAKGAHDESSGLPSQVTCPFCGSTDTEPLGAFGSLLMTAQYYCRGCRTTFEWVRKEGD